MSQLLHDMFITIPMESNKELKEGQTIQERQSIA